MMLHSLILSLFWACTSTNKVEENTNIIADSGTNDSAEVIEERSDIAYNPRIYRLTHLQWQNSVLDLLNINAASMSETFIESPYSSGFNNHADHLVVENILFQDYQRAAENLSNQVIQDLELYAFVVSEDPREGGSTIAYSQRYEAEGPEAVASTGGPSGSQRYNLWSNGTLTIEVDLPTGGLYEISTLVIGSDCGDGIGAAMEFRLDGETIHNAEVLGEQEIATTIEISSGAHSIAVAFTNDCYAPDEGFDRNLIVDWIEVEGGIDLGTSSIDIDDMRAWVNRIVAQGYRRSLSTTEESQWWNIFESAAELYNTGDDIADGVQMVLTTLLQSPHFLYRIENTAPSQRLSDAELASKLSFQICNQPPDMEIRQDIADGVFFEQYEYHIQRLLNSECGAETLIDLHRQLFHTESYDNIFKLDPAWEPELNEAFKEEFQQFIQWHIFQENGTLKGLYTADYTIANQEIAALYGETVTGEGFEKIALNPNERSGILTMVGPLSKKAETAQSSPIHRGVFINHAVLCKDLPPPPDVVPGLPAQEAGMSNRERIEAHTGDGTCGEGCHSNLINPPGFAFEHYDELGRYRDSDNDLPIDATGSFYFQDFGILSWNNAIDFSHIVSDSYEAHSCYAEHLFTYYLGRDTEDLDEGILSTLTSQSQNDSPINHLVVDIFLSDAFQYRGAQ